jgi:hypothetical protein
LDYHRRKFIWVGVKKKKIIHMVKLWMVYRYENKGVCEW